LHSFTQALRIQIKNTNIKVELAPHVWETPLFRGDFDGTDLGGKTGMDVMKLAGVGFECSDESLQKELDSLK
jgi:uncharacterized oxidoreductase